LLEEPSLSNAWKLKKLTKKEEEEREAALKKERKDKITQKKEGMKEDENEMV